MKHKRGRQNEREPMDWRVSMCSQDEGGHFTSVPTPASLPFESPHFIPPALILALARFIFSASASGGKKTTGHWSLTSVSDFPDTGTLTALW